MVHRALFVSAGVALFALSCNSDSTKSGEFADSTGEDSGDAVGGVVSSETASTAAPAETTADPNECANCPDSIRFDRLEVGQRSRYRAFTTTLRGEQQPLEYADVFATVEVIEQGDDSFLLEETYEGDLSTVLGWEPEQESTISYEARIEGDGIIFLPVLEEWYSFVFPLNRSLSLLTVVEPEAEVVGAELDPEFELGWVFVGAVPELQLFGSTYGPLTGVKDYGQTLVDGPGYTFIYSAGSGLVRSTSYNPWNGAVVGWDLLPAENFNSK